MSNAVSALGGKAYTGFATVREIGPMGTIALRVKPDVKGLKAAVKSITGTALPDPRRIAVNADPKAGRATGWMSPDEYLLLLPYAEVGAALAALDEALKGQHYLAADVSDARAVFRVEGPRATEVLMKLAPVDFAALAAGELRRSRIAQVAAAFWKYGDGYTLVCFRSVAGYVMGCLETSARPGSELFPA